MFNTLKFNRMNFKFIHKIALLTITGFLILSACTPENSVEIIETTEEIKNGFKMAVNGAEIETDAFAAFCQSDTSEVLIISNKIEHLRFPLQPFSFEVNDFAYTLYKGANSSWSYGGQALSEDVTGFPGLSVLFSDANIIIDSNNGEIVVGSSEGVLFGMDSIGGFNSFPYTMEFTADIVKESDCE